MRFHNREHAARLLAEKLAVYRGQHPLVLGIPRGAVPMAKVIADALAGDLDVVLVHKLGAPNNPELAIGSVDESGHVFLHEYAGELGVDERYIEQEKQAQLKMLRHRRAQYTPVRPPLDPTGRPPETAARIRKEADELVCLDTPQNFIAVGQFFEDFSQVSDEQAIAILRQSGAKAA
jgi:putative phosphoribosyl transferase